MSAHSSKILDGTDVAYSQYGALTLRNVNIAGVPTMRGLPETGIRLGVRGMRESSNEKEARKALPSRKERNGRHQQHDGNRDRGRSRQKASRRRAREEARGKGAEGSSRNHAGPTEGFDRADRAHQGIARPSRSAPVARVPSGSLRIGEDVAGHRHGQRVPR